MATKKKKPAPRLPVRYDWAAAATPDTVEVHHQADGTTLVVRQGPRHRMVTTLDIGGLPERAIITPKNSPGAAWFRQRGGEMLACTEAQYSAGW